MQQGTPMTDAATDITPALHRFISLFNYSLITISVQPGTYTKEDGTKGTYYVPNGRYFTSLNKIRALTPEQFFSPRVQGELQHCNTQGCHIYFTINEGDGLPDPEAEPGKDGTPNINCGKRKNIKRLTALAIDTDTADATALLEELTRIALLPHAVVQTRPGRFHFYFLLEQAVRTGNSAGLVAEGENILQWQALQRKLASLVPNLDQSLSDINQVLRLPTFFNPKSTPPSEVKLIRTSNHVPYNMAILYDRLEAYKFNPLLTGELGNKGPGVSLLDNGVNSNGVYLNGQAYSNTFNKFEFPAQPQSLPEGNRRTAITRYIEHVMENILPLDASDNDYWTLIDAFIIKYCKPRDATDFLPGGSRRVNIEQYFNDQRLFRQRKRAALESAKAIKEFDHVQAVEQESLPDDFYYTFPGDLGMIAKEIHSYAPFLTAEMCFAGALNIAGGMKAELQRYKGSWPCINGLVIAGTGAGKSTLKHVIEQSFLKAGLLGKYPQLLTTANSVQALHHQLYSAGGVGTCLIDESGDYLESLMAKNAPAYLKMLRKFYKEATTGNSFITSGVSRTHQLPPVVGGMLSLWMFVQPSKFIATLSAADIADGFLPRFFLFKGKTVIDLTGDFNAKPFNPSMDFEVWLQSHVQHFDYGTDAALVPLLDAVEQQVKAASPKAKLEAIREAQMHEVYRIRSESRALRVDEVRVCEDGEALLRVYLKEQEERAKELLAKAGESAPEIGFYVRFREMLHRLIACAATFRQEVSRGVVERCIEYHRYQTDTLFAGALKDVVSTASEKSEAYVMKALVKAVKKAGDAVPLKLVTLAFSDSSKRPENMTQVLKNLVSSGQVWAEEREHKRAKGKKVLVYRPALDEDQLV